MKIDISAQVYNFLLLKIIDDSDEKIDKIIEESNVYIEYEINKYEKVKYFGAVGTSEEVDNFVNVYFDEFPSDNLKSLIMRQYIAIDSYVNAITFVKGLNIDTSNLEIELEDMRKLFEQETSLDKLKEYLSKLIKKIIDLRYSVSGNKNSEIVNIAKEYINSNYMEDEISLNSIALYVNMSSSYFSALFRK